MSDYLTYALSGIITLVVFYLAGHFILSFYKVISLNSILSYFIKSIIGLSLFVLINAIIYTNGNTVIWGLLILTIPYFKKISVKGIFSRVFSFQKKELEIVVFSILLFITIFSIMSFSNIYPGNFIKTPHPDIIFNAKVSKYIYDFGIETFSLNYSNQNIYVLPYHYFELWLNGAISKTFGLNQLRTYLLITQAFELTLISIGFSSVLMLIGKYDKKWVLLFGLLIFIFTGVQFDFFQDIRLLDVSSVFVRTPLNYQKLLPIYIFTLLIFICLLYGDLQKTISVSLCLPIISISTTPGVMIGSVCFLLVMVFSKQYKFKEIVVPMIQILSIACFLLFFYFIFNQKTNELEVVLSTNNFVFLSYFTTFVNVIIGTSLTYLVIYLPLVMILLFFLLKGYLKGQIQLMLIYCSILFSSLLISWAIFHEMADSVQLFSNLTVPLVNILLLLVVFNIYPILKSNYKAILALLFMLISINNILVQYPDLYRTAKYDVSFLEQVKKEINAHDNHMAFLKSSEDYIDIFSKNDKFATLGNYCLQFNDNLRFHSLSVLDIPIIETSLHANLEKIFVSESIFYQFLQAQKESSTQNICELQLKFIKKYNVRHLILSPKTTLPECLEPYVLKKIIDKKSAEKFMILQIFD